MDGKRRKEPAEEVARQAAKRAKAPNADIAEFLNELAEFEKNVSRVIYKYNVYRKAARAVAALDTRLTSGAEAQKIEGIGKKIGEKIDEFLSTGKLAKLEKIKGNDDYDAIQKIASLVGFGPAAAQRYVAKGVKTIEDLAKQSDLNNAQRVGVKYAADLSERIPRAEVDQLREKTLKLIRQVDPKLTAEVCGSYRRGAATSGDMDILMTHPDFLSDGEDKSPKKSKYATLLRKVVDHLQADGFVSDVLSCGKSKFAGVCSLDKDAKHRRIDIGFWPADQYPLAVLYFTGSDEFNKNMRRKAIDKGFHLNEYSLRPSGEHGKLGPPLAVQSERDVFDFLDEPYVAPTER